MKTTLTITVLALAFAFGANLTFAAPYKAADKNPQTEAFYVVGTHGIPSQPGITHEGTNMVKRNGNSGNFEAWFEGTSDEEGEHGHHTVWKISKDGTCQEDATFIADAYLSWGDYLVAGADYCVLDNTYHSQ